MNDKLEILDHVPRAKVPPTDRTPGRENVENTAVFTVKLRVAAPLDHLIAQLYRSWPKVRARKDN